MNPGTIQPTPSGLKTPAELEAAAKKKAEAANSKKTALQRSKERLEREEKNRLNAEKREAAEYRDQVASNATGSITPEVAKPPVVKPAVVKFAAPVPGKQGFVYNPYTHNQVDVRGIPSGTKVRDPHDSNPAHIFKVP
ncbi:MAG: hypothetical protein ACSHX6_14290 [Akkermansiaceae bacterium]